MNFITKLFKSKNVLTAHDLQVIKRLAFQGLVLFRKTRKRNPGKLAARRIIQQATDIAMADYTMLDGHVGNAFYKLSK